MFEIANKIAFFASFGLFIVVNFIVTLAFVIRLRTY